MWYNFNIAKQTYRRIRDPIHGLIDFSEREQQLIDTQVFQRLRRIRQLAMAFLIYPSALHTRFDHSVGVMHIAGRICTRLQELNPDRISDEDIANVRFAALLHDVGHGPFSHLSENLLEKFAPAQTCMGITCGKIHEKITIDIIRNDSQIKGILDDKERKFLIDMIQGKPTRDWKRDIVSSELDADKMDYLLRDSYFAGVKYGEYDLEKLIESCLIVDRPETQSTRSETQLALDSEGLYALEQFMLARYHMKQQVYWHEVSLISDEMITRGITLAIEDGNKRIAELYKYPRRSKKDTDQDYEEKRKDFVQNYLDYHDEKVIDLLRNCKQRKANKIFNRLYNRELFNTITGLRFKYEDMEIRDRLRKMVADPDRKRQCEKKIAKCIGSNADVDYIIVNKPPVRNLNYDGQPKPQSSEAVMIFEKNNKKQDTLESVGEYAGELFLARHYSGTSPLEIVQVYAPYQVSEKKERKIQGILRSS